MANTGELEFVAKLTDEASDETQRLRRTMDTLGGPVDAITAAVEVEARNIEATEGDIDSALDRIVAEAEAAGDDAGSGFGENLAAGVGDLGAKMTPIVAAAGVAIGAVLVGSLVGAMNFEAANDKLAASLGLSVEESERIGGVAGALYADAYGENIGEVNGAVEAVYSSIDGMTTASSDALRETTEDALNFASAFDVDVARAAQIAGQAVRTGLADNATEAFDLLTAASQKVPAAIREDLLDAADEYGPFFAQLGYSGEDAFAALVAGSEQGMYGIDKTGDALKELTIRATDMSTSSVAAYQAAGLNAEDMAAKFLAGGDVASGALSELVDGILSIEDPTARANAAIGLFGTPLEDLGTAQIPSFLEGLKSGTGGLGDFEGAADRAGDTLNDNAATNIESFKRQAMTLATDVIGGKLLPMFSDVASTLSTQFGPAVEAVTGWMSENQRVVGLVATVLGTVTGVIVTLVAAMRIWAAVQAVLNVVMSANPIGIIIVAIAALVAAIVYIATQTTWFQDIWGGVWGWITQTFNGAVELVKAGLAALSEWWSTTWNNIQAAARLVWTVIVTVVRTYINTVLAVVRGVMNTVVGFWSGVWNGIRNTVSAVWNGIKSVISTAINAVKTTVSGVLNVIRGIFSGNFEQIKAGVGQVLQGIVGLVAGIPGSVIGALGNIGSTLYNSGKSLIQGFKDGIMDAFNSVKNAVSNGLSGIRDLFPFSPAKEGPFSGRGYTSFSGRALASDFAKGIASEASTVQAAAEDLLGAASLDASPVIGTAVAGSRAGVSQASGPAVVTIRHQVALTGDVPQDLSAEELARIIAGDARARSTMERVVREETRARTVRTITAS